MYRDCYPLTNYIIRPTAWKSNNPGQHIQKQYFTDYPDETNRFQLGGFHVAKEFPFNLDYSKRKYCRPL